MSGIDSCYWASADVASSAQANATIAQRFFPIGCLMVCLRLLRK